MTKTRILSDFELGRLVAGIESVRNGVRPIARCGSMAISRVDMNALRSEISRALWRPCRTHRNRERPVQGFIRKQGGYVLWGVYRFRWAFDALSYLELERHPSGRHLYALLLGYSAERVAEVSKSDTKSSASRSKGRFSNGTLEIVRPYGSPIGRRTPSSHR